MLDRSALPPLTLAIARAESPAAVLRETVEAIATQPEAALARIWLIEPVSRSGGHICTDLEPGRALHLRASAGTSFTGHDWSRTDGRFFCLPLNQTLKLGQVALSGEPAVQDLRQNELGVADRAWVEREQLAGFLAQPLANHGEVLGVLAYFSRSLPGDSCRAWIELLAGHTAAALRAQRELEASRAGRLRLQQERDYLVQEIQEKQSLGEILGHSEPAMRLQRQIALVAGTDAAVLIEGEPGSGKELAARAIHQASPRAGSTLVKLSCATVPRQLFESTLFGHVAGAFPDANGDREGRLSLADGGTLFLDEAGEIPLEVQEKLLRALQGGGFERVGEERTRYANARVIAATSRDLRRESEAGRFRLELYYWLGVFLLPVPPLRERRDDIPLLAARFIQQASRRNQLPEPRLPHSELLKLERYDWPGNVRELQHVIERAVILARGGRLQFDGLSGGHAGPVLVPVPGDPEIIPEALWREKERHNLLTALRKARGRISGRGGAADLLGIPPSTLTSRLKALGIDPRQLRGTATV